MTRCDRVEQFFDELARRKHEPRLTVGYTQPAQIIATGITLALLPAARYLPALAALGLLTAVLVAVVGYERLTRQATAD